tara:strand:- start:6279 stop:6413 length:135 start_codon:yes stop_codon:yes gene_type:complete
MGFLLSAAFEIPAKLRTEIIIADINDITFRIYSPFLILRNLLCA